MTKLLSTSQLIALVFALILTAALASVATSQDKSPAFDTLTSEQMKTVVVHLERTGCYGNCPAYKLAIYGDGRVEYEGIRDVKVVGKKNGKIDESGLRSILTAFSKAKFFMIGENVSEEKCSCRRCTDFPNVLTDIAIGGSKHTVSHYHGCACASKELFELETAIDRAVKVDQWTGDVSKAGPFGTTCFGG